MNKYLEQLIVLSQIDKELDSFVLRVDEATKNLKEKCLLLDKTVEEIETLDKDIKDIEHQKIQNNNHILEFNEKIKELSKKSAAIKTEKEASALKIEEDIAKEQLDAANEEIDRLDKILENKEKFKQELKLKRDEFESEVDEIDAKTKVVLVDIEKERLEIYDKKVKLIGEINQKVLTFYEKIRKWAHNSAVVPVRKHACYGCFMRIYDKTYLAVLKGDEIVTCPHCGRILYREKEENQS
ncbi:zinc ribbon domain-containing protein [Campylobacter sp.]|uniref:zinc ribbon domain-containing protein n=1 Tax=Campylobacter sp. TaxID=205 RepID=UPI0025C0D1D9|nr:zinc ribbon domain-containing protein [Campylobacter sp.]